MSVRKTNLKTADQMTRYYIKRDNLEVYYCENQEFNGYWGGKAAKLLGLDKYIADEAFSRLSHNLHPLTGEQLTARMREDRRPGFDITFDVPKSVSLAYAYSKDDRIVRLVRQIVHDTMEEMELQAAARVRANLDKDADLDRTTGNFVYAEFIHLTARPENGYSDPHFHVHVVVMNLTFDPVEQKWKALQTGGMHQDIRTYQGAFHRRLKEGLEELGLEVEPSKHLFEIKGIERDLVEKFSRRTKTIEETAARLGITDPAQKARLGAMTREKKDKTLSIPDLEPFWWGGLSPEHKEALEGVKTRLQRSLARELSSQMAAPAAERSANSLGRFDQPLEPREIEPSSDLLGTKKRPAAGQAERPRSINKRTEPGAAQEKVHEATEHDRRAVAMAAEHLFERESAVTEMRLLGEALNNWTCDKATRTGIIQAVAEAPLLRQEHNGRVYVTTAEIVAEEQRLTDLCLRGKGKFEPINEFWKISDERLNAGQRAAALHVLNSRDFITGISGVAGSGKTTVMHEIKRGIEAGCYRVVVLAPLAATARGTLRKDGFENATTIAHFLKSETMQREAAGAVLLVDEAGLIPSRLADKFLPVAEKLGARVILVGDTGQLHSVQRGQAFEHLRKSGKMAVAAVTEILRQSGPYKQFVEMYIAGETRRAVTSLWSTGSMVEQPLAELAQTLATDYVGMIERGKTVLVVSPTHAEGDILTEAIREKLKERNLLGKSVKTERLQNLSWPEGKKSHHDSYKRGMVVQFNGKVKGFAPGERVEVIDVRDDAVRVRSNRSQRPGIKMLPLNEAEKFEVYERASGDTVKWDTLRNLAWSDAQKSDPEHYEIGQVVQINDQVKGFALGEQMEIIGVSDEGVRVRSHSNTLTPRIKALPLSQPDKFAVYERKTIELCEGDEILITGNGYTADKHRLTNGMQYQVDHLSPDGKLVLNNGWRIKKEFPHVAHGRVLTPYAAQGKTVDWVFACQTQELSSAATNRIQYHVATTRGREGLMNYTDNFEWLKDRVTEMPEHLMATELLHGEQNKRAPAQDQRLCELEKKEFAMLPEIEECDMQSPQPETATKISAPENGKELSEKLGACKAEQLAMEAEAELERRLCEKRAMVVEPEMEMEMGM